MRLMNETEKEAREMKDGSERLFSDCTFKSSGILQRLIIYLRINNSQFSRD